MATERPLKLLRLNLHLVDKKLAAHISILGDPAEVRMSAGGSNFISVNADSGVSLSAGMGKKINNQGLGNTVEGGMVAPLQFPMSIIPNTPYTSFAAASFSPPLAAIMGTVIALSAMATGFL